MTEDNHLKLFIEEAKLIQDIIKRMADNSFKIKGWTVALIVIAMIFRSQVDSIFIVFIPLLAFCILDSYYLSIERKFRILYDIKVRDFRNTNFDNIFKFNINTKINLCDILESFISKSIWIFYGSIFVLVLVFKCLN